MQDLHLDPVPVTIWTIVLVISFVLVTARIFANLRYIQAYRRELVMRAKALRIHRMLDRVGTTLSRYLRKTRPIDVERHLLACQNCETTGLCDKYLDQGEGIDPHTFCPNFAELVVHMPSSARHGTAGQPSPRPGTSTPQSG